jgi:FAD/FMN-containing dehydrogenase
VAASLVALCIASSHDSQTKKGGTTRLDAAAANRSITKVLDSMAHQGDDEDENGDDDGATTNVINWSGTHMVTVRNKNYWEPESIEEVEAIVKECHAKGHAIRPIGASLSPNGLALNAAGMISLAHLDKIIEINPQRKTVTAQAGVTVNQVRK